MVAVEIKLQTNERVQDVSPLMKGASRKVLTTRLRCGVTFCVFTESSIKLYVIIFGTRGPVRKKKKEKKCAGPSLTVFRTALCFSPSSWPQSRGSLCLSPRVSEWAHWLWPGLRWHHWNSLGAASQPCRNVLPELTREAENTEFVKAGKGNGVKVRLRSRVLAVEERTSPTQAAFTLWW